MTSNTRKILPAKRAPKLTRAAVAEGLQSVPIDTILLGVAGAKQSKLTAKQRAFAEGIAMGKSKAGAYRDAYDSQAKPHHQSLEGQRLAASPAIAHQIAALQLANEARKYATPAALRSLVIERLTATAIDDDIKPAQRLRALELLGKVTEVAAFTERREIIKTDSAGDARAMLLDNLRTALRASAINVPATLIDSQTDDPGAARDAQARAPTQGRPPDPADAHAHPLLSNPHIRSDDLEHTQSDTFDQISVPSYPDPSTDLVTPVTEKGGAVVKDQVDMTDGDIEDPPGGNWK